MIPGARNPADLSQFVRERTLAIERSVRRRRMVLLVLSLVGAFALAVTLLLAGLVEQSERRASHRRIAMYGLDGGARFVVSPLEMRRETERSDMRVALRLVREEGLRPRLARRVVSFLEARGGE